MADSEYPTHFSSDTVNDFLGLTRSEICSVFCENVFFVQGARRLGDGLAEKTYCQNVPFRFKSKGEAYRKLNEACGDVGELGRTWIETMAKVSGRIFVTDVSVDLTATEAGGIVTLNIDVLISAIPTRPIQRRRARLLSPTRLS